MKTFIFACRWTELMMLYMFGLTEPQKPGPEFQIDDDPSAVNRRAKSVAAMERHSHRCDDGEMSIDIQLAGDELKCLADEFAESEGFALYEADSGMNANVFLDILSGELEDIGWHNIARAYEQDVYGVRTMQPEPVAAAV